MRDYTRAGPILLQLQNLYRSLSLSRISEFCRRNVTNIDKTAPDHGEKRKSPEIEVDACLAQPERQSVYNDRRNEWTERHVT